MYLDGTHKDWNYTVEYFTDHWNGYVVIPKGHKFHGKDYDDVDLRAPGNLTYSGDTLELDTRSTNLGKWVIGFDLTHAWDMESDPTEENPYHMKNIRTIDDAVSGCKEIIDQLVKLEPKKETEK